MTSPSGASSGLALEQIALVVLAAGRSTRLGSPKALLALDGRPLLEHLLAAPLLRRLGDVVVVLGHHAEAIRPIVERSTFRHLLNPDPDRGRTNSIQTGLAALGPEIQAVFLQPVDCPLVLPETYLALIEAIGSAEVVIPSLHGEHGHPPLFSRALFALILAAGPDEPLRDVFQSSGVRRRFVEVHDAGVLVNVNHPEDLQELEDLYAARGPRFAFSGGSLGAR